jgi:hypothetical protein
MPKKIPYGQSNFEKIMLGNYIYVDKTKYIELLENESNDYNFLIRPRKFGKSLFLSVLWNYYDVVQKDKFEQLFGSLYIGKHPTGKQNSMFVLRFSFAGIDTSNEEDFKKSFTEAIKFSVQSMLTDHKDILEDYDILIEKLWALNSIRGYLEFALDVVKNKNCKAYIIIDEYDHFANDLIAIGTRLSNEQYKSAIWANGVVRDFYETLKDATQTVIDKIFITGVTPIMLDDITSGFNISNNVSLDLAYNEILGCTRKEVDYIIQEAGINKDDINIDIEYFYDGYLFHPDGKNKLYNSSMIGYYLGRVLKEGKNVRYLIDDNLKTDYGRIRNLLNKPSNINKLNEVILNGYINAPLKPKFSIDFIHDENNFPSMLYFLGLLTMGEKINGDETMRIPNYSVQTMYWGFIERLLKDEVPEFYYDSSKIIEALSLLRRESDPKPFMQYICDGFLSRLSNRDFIKFDEKDLKLLMLGILFQSNYYLPISEMENGGGYSDIYLKRGNRFPDTQYEWVWELKYIKEKDKGNNALIAGKKADALTQINHYKESATFKDRTDVRYLIVIFLGDTQFEIEEV